MTKFSFAKVAAPVNEAAYLTNVAQASFAHAKSTDTMVAWLQSGDLNWSDKERISEVARAFRIGRMAYILGLSLEAAALVNDKLGFSDKADAADDRRTKREQDAYNAGKMAWSYVAKMAGMPKLAGGKRAPKVSTANDVKAQAIVDASPVPVTKAEKEAAKVQERKLAIADKVLAKATTPDEVGAFAQELARLVDAFCKRSGDAKGGPWTAILTDFAATVRRTAKAAPEASQAAHAPAPTGGAASVGSSAVHAAA